MLKKVFLFTLIFLTSTSSFTYSKMLSIPELPNQSEEEIIAIVTTKDKASKKQIDQLLSTYKGIEIRQIYSFALQGFSVKGKRGQVELLTKHRMVETVSEVASYKTELKDSVPFIGGTTIRGYYDEQNRRLTGKGVKVGVIDTGIDYRHPDLQRSYKGGRDLVDGDLDPMETRNAGELSTMHGTHVAGIIAANGKLKGVAPEAEIYAYRALGPGGFGNTEQVIAAIDYAIQDKVDVLNLSLGNSVNGPDLPISIALNNAVEHGIVAVTSNGNSGPNVWTVGSPGTADKAISVGASTPPLQLPFLKAGLGAFSKKISVHPIEGSKSWDFPFTEEIVDAGNGAVNELKNAKEKIALVKRGGLTFYEKIQNAKKAGAKGIIIYNNTKGNFFGQTPKKIDIPAVSISKEAGVELLAGIKRDGRVQVKSFFQKTSDQIASFSSRGPVTVTWDIKPDVVAPGVAIDSTVPNGYISMQGTSMSAPHVAGACALLKQAHPDWTPEQFKSALMTTAKQLKDDNGEYYRTFEQGGGRIQIDKAVQADTFFYPSSLSFGMYEKAKGNDEHRRKFVIQNTSQKTKNYSFKIPKKEEGLTWNLPIAFKLLPGEKKEVKVGLHINPSLLIKGLYDGYLEVNEGATSLHLPYLYVKEEPDYPRVMGFDIGVGDHKDSLRYEMYLPGGADEMGIALYDADTYRFIGFLDLSKKVHRGMITKELEKNNLPPTGVYHAIIFAKKAGKEDRIDTLIEIP
jgi:minor extracellular serine protease Vpr